MTGNRNRLSNSSIRKSSLQFLNSKIGSPIPQSENRFSQFFNSQIPPYLVHKYTQGFKKKVQYQVSTFHFISCKYIIEGQMDISAMNINRYISIYWYFLIKNWNRRSHCRWLYLEKRIMFIFEDFLPKWEFSFHNYWLLISTILWWILTNTFILQTRAHLI